MVFSFPEEPGKLFNALSAFALREINLTKIESRPFRDDPIKLSPRMGRLFQYRFYIDFSGHLGSTKVQNAIVHLQVPSFLVEEGADSPQPSVPFQFSQTSGRGKLYRESYQAGDKRREDGALASGVGMTTEIFMPSFCPLSVMLK